MPPLYDCVIVGAGPAGATAAYHLARRGHAVLLLEKQSLPRYKPCGGGVSPQVADWFDYDFAPVISQVVTHVRFTYNLADAVTLPLSAPIWMVRRDEFDHYMVQQAQAAGAALQDGTKATGIGFEGDRYHITTPAGTVAGRYLIAADGAKGPLARWLGFDQRQAVMAGAIETEPRLPVSDGHVVHFEFGLVQRGYVWNFPKADGYSLGSGAFLPGQRRSRDLVAPLARYAQQFGVDTGSEAQHGHPLLIWNGDQPLHTQRALLAGEAACMVDPLTAEGIRPAIFSGLKAADAIHQALAGDELALPGYSETMIREWGSDLRWAARLAQAFYRAPKLGYRVAVKHPRSTQIVGQIMSGQLRYADVVNRGLRRISAGLLSAG